MGGEGGRRWGGRRHQPPPPHTTPHPPHLPDLVCPPRRRSKKHGGGRQYAFDKQIDARTGFDAVVASRMGPQPKGASHCKIGEDVLTACGRAELTSLTEGGGCVVTFRSGSTYHSRSYSSTYGKSKGSARLQPIPPSLLPTHRSSRNIEQRLAVCKAITEHAPTYCKTSPHQRDVVKKRTGPFTLEHRPGLILEDVREAMYTDFEEKHPGLLKFSQWKKVVKDEVWQIKKAYRLTCLDRVDSNYNWHREALVVVAKQLAELLHPPEMDAEQDNGDDDAPQPAVNFLEWVPCCLPSLTCDECKEVVSEALAAALATGQTSFMPTEWEAFQVTEISSKHFVRAGDQYFKPMCSMLQQLIDFASLRRNTHIGNALVCGNCLGDGTPQACIDGSCERCGFQRLWSNGLRTEIFDADGKLADDAHALWSAPISWDCLKPGGDDTQGTTSDDLRHSVSGTFAEFLDAFEIVQRNWLPHRFHGVYDKQARCELDKVMTPTKIKDDSDW